MSEKKSAFLSRKLILCIAAAVCAVIAVIVFFALRARSTGYRDISVFEISADGVVSRNGEELSVYQGMKLQNGDNLKVTGEGFLRLLLDQDKYVSLEPGTEINLTVSGNDTDSHTQIELVAGRILNEIDSKLSENSSYEITTPASVMAVRGTAFYVSCEPDGSGSYTVDLAVLDGTVGTTASGAETEQFVEAGEAAQLFGNEDGAQVTYINEPISYDTLPSNVLNRIEERKENGDWAALPVTTEELKAALSIVEPDTAPNQTTETADTKTQAKTQETTDDSSANNSEADSEQPAGTEKTGRPKKPAENSPTDNEDDSSEQQPNTPPAANSPAPTEQQPSGGTDGPGKNAVTDKKPGDGNSFPAVPVNHTVLFTTADGKVFARQTIEDGACAVCPTLIPTGGSNWYLNDAVYDFDTPVTTDLTLCYK